MRPKAEGRTVLVVDDDEAARAFVRQCLEPLGVEVVEAEHEEGALEKLAERCPDLVCLDLMLPDGSGLDVCERMGTSPLLRGVPVLVISARRLPQDRALALAMGAAGYLTKPFTRESLLAHAGALLARRASEEVPLRQTQVR